MIILFITVVGILLMVFDDPIFWGKHRQLGMVLSVLFVIALGAFMCLLSWAMISILHDYPAVSLAIACLIV